MATSIIPKQYIVDEVESGNVAANKTAGCTASVSAAKTGYKPIGILGISKTVVGSGNVTAVLLSSYSLTSAGVASATFYNTSANDRTMKVTFTILYEKTA